MRFIGQDNHISLVRRETTITNQVFADVHSVIDAAIELVPGASVVDSNQEGLLTGHGVQIIVKYSTQDSKEPAIKISESQMHKMEYEGIVED